MNNLNRTARIVGALFLISNATFLIGAMGLLEPMLNAPDYLAQVSTNSNQVILGALLELVNGVAYIGIAVLMFPIFRQRFESMALGYVAFRIIEFITQFASSIVPLILVTLSGDFAAAAAPGSQAVGELLLASRYWSFEVLSLVFAISALMFYTMFYYTRLIPRFLSVWGLIGAGLVLVNTLAEIFSVDLGTAMGYVTGMPMLFNELFLGVWLLIKGFSTDAVITEPTETITSTGQLLTS